VSGKESRWESAGFVNNARSATDFSRSWRATESVPSLSWKCLGAKIVFFEGSHGD
jgi:hypothetical protein